MCAEQPKFSSGEIVLLRRTNEHGMIEDPPEREAGEFLYSVRVGKQVLVCFEEDLDELTDPEASLNELGESGRWGNLDAVRTALAVERIKNTNRSTIYAFQNQRIKFQPHQYKPLLKVLDSPDRRLLIADEVGLGKTIEAGLIFTELKARQDLQSVMVVCPSRLREKWKNELSGKFDEDFEILDRRGFESVSRAFLERPGRSRIRGIMSHQAMRSEKVREVLTGELGSLDLVIFDEAHHARNSNTSTHSLLSDLCEVSDAVILLTATPVQLDNSNLFNLLRTLRPNEFRDLWAFEQSLEHFSVLHKASSLARTQSPANINEIRQILIDTFIENRDTNSVDPLAELLIRELAEEPPAERSSWIGVERRIQDLHPLGTILTRTKKRDVSSDAAERKAFTYRCAWTTEEDEAYQRLVDGSGSRGWPSSSLSFGQIQRARQAASCLPAAYAHQGLAKTDDEATEATDILPSDIEGGFDDEGAALPPAAWEGRDTKYEKFRHEILDSVWREDPEAKILVFAFFKGTVRYLERRLSESGVNVRRIDGDVPSDPRNPERDERGKIIRDFKRDPEIKVLVSSEVGSEGLDFQFCHHLVNYDLPWNPMVVEQRIGRIDRFGQKSDKIFIHNLVVEGTVEDRILERLYQRIGIFSRSIGALEAILGETVRKLQREYLRAELTEEEAERRREQAENAIAQSEHEIEALEQNASHLFGHEEYVKEELLRVRKLGQFVSEKQYLAILNTYFHTCHPDVRIREDGGSMFTIRLSDALRADLHRIASKVQQRWVDKSRDGLLHFTTDGDIAFENPELELVNTGHPLIRAAIEGLGNQLSSPTARIGSAEVKISLEESNAFKDGDYFLVLAPLKIEGVRSRRVIETIAVNADTGEVLSREDADRLLYLTTDTGENLRPEDSRSLTPDLWEDMQRELRRRLVKAKKIETQENKALYVRRRNALVKEHEHNLLVRQKRLETSMRNKREDRIIRMFEAQVEAAKAKHELELDELEGQQESRVQAQDAIALCMVRVIT